MTKQLKILPCLDIKQGRVVKGVRFTDIQDTGTPSVLARKYQEEGADGLVFLDIAASGENRPTCLSWVKEVKEAVSIPITVGGGIAHVNTALALKEMGADSISLNSAAIQRPRLIAECVEALGKESVILAVDVRRSIGNEGKSRWEVLRAGGTQGTGMDAIEWIQQGIDLGCGGLLPTVLDRDGTQEGYDLELLHTLRSLTNLPLIASGGAGKIEHFAEAWKAGADCVLAASVFHFGQIRIGALKEYLRDASIPVKEG